MVYTEEEAQVKVVMGESINAISNQQASKTKDQTVTGHCCYWLLIQHSQITLKRAHPFPGTRHAISLVRDCYIIHNSLGIQHNNVPPFSQQYTTQGSAGHPSPLRRA